MHDWSATSPDDSPCDENADACGESVPAETERSPNWTEHITWGAVLAVGWLIYAYTTEPAVGIAIACTKFGWNDLQTAQWLYRYDPHRGRGRACFWFFLASALWKITVAAFLVTAAILVGAAMAGHRPPKALISSSLTAGIGLCLLSVVPLVGIAYARYYGVKVWVNSTVNEARRENYWPPLAYDRNKAGGLVGTALIIPVIVTAVSLARVGALFVIGALALEMVAAWAASRGVIAATPSECWGDAAPAVVRYSGGGSDRQQHVAPDDNWIVDTERG